ncbi:MAG: single-stranded-DNA-specific exonuclease RecJ [Patescibacteria group bacterium]|jgi:single-stranded-DNA-specific exonuclease|nr:single-stranded-DNA-specific exonuclease RecJ [Patescibacteria group bacterium]
MEKIWQIQAKMPKSLREDYPTVNPLILQILFNRGLKTKEDLRWFLSDEEEFLDPFLFKDMKAAVALIIDHIKKRNKIMIFGDYDADGVTSAALLYDVFSILKASVDFYIPDRVSEGYGLNKKALDQIKADGFSLVVTVDNGIRNKEEVDYAQSLGLDIIITDHHAYPEKKTDWPSCLIINPADKASGYPFRYLAGVGVAFKLASALILESKLGAEDKEILIERTLDLTAIGTVSDMVPLIGENRLIVQWGLKVLDKTKRLGLLELLRVSGGEGKIDSFRLGFHLGPRLNAASRMKHANSALNLLISKDPSEARLLAEDLNDKNMERQEMTDNVLAAAESQLDVNNIPKIIIVKDLSNNSWNEGVIGLVAGRLSEKYYRPVLIIVKTGETAVASDGQKYSLYKGSARSIEGFSLVEALEDSKDFLYKYGGHPMAGGFSILAEENVFAFIDNINSLAEKKISLDLLKPKIKVDAELNFSSINNKLLELIERLAPFGQINTSPCFATFKLKIIDIVKMGKEEQHIKIRFLNHEDKEMKSFWGISFGGADKYSNLKLGDTVDLLYSLEFNNFNGKREIQLRIMDIV